MATRKDFTSSPLADEHAPSSQLIFPVLGDTGYRANPDAFSAQMEVFSRMREIERTFRRPQKVHTFLGNQDHGANAMWRDGSHQEIRHATALYS
jgi:hypothetical protein